MQNVYITRNGKQIQLTVDEIKAAWAAWDAELRGAVGYLQRRSKTNIVEIK